MGTKGKGKRWKKEEKTKVKFKVGKSLPKNTNVTDLKFRTRRIVVPDQSKVVEAGAVVTRKRKTLKDLLEMLAHFNSKARMDGLEGLSELCSHNFAEITGNSVSVLTKLGPVCCDKEDKVRRLAAKTLHGILSQSELAVLLPSSRVLVANVSAAMTHVVPEIRKDSLRFFDSVLDSKPELLFVDAGRVLKDFLCQISAPLNSSRGVQTECEWIHKVLQRLNTFCLGLEAGGGSGVNESVGQTILYDRRRPIFVDLPLLGNEPLQMRKQTRLEEVFSEDFISSLMPLMLAVASDALAVYEDSLPLAKAEVAACVAELLGLVMKHGSGIAEENRKRIEQTFKHFPYEVNALVSQKSLRKLDGKKGTKRERKDNEDTAESGLHKAGSVAVALNLCLVPILARSLDKDVQRKAANYFVDLLQDGAWIGLCSPKKVAAAIESISATQSSDSLLLSDVISAGVKAVSQMHPLKKERFEISNVLKTFFEKEFVTNRQRGVDVTESILFEWALETVGLLRHDCIRPELFPLLVDLCKLGHPRLHLEMQDVLKEFCTDLKSKTFHRSEWSDAKVAKSFLDFLMWNSVQLDETTANVMVSLGICGEEQLHKLFLSSLK
ncbi:unnamed protein product [Notodromas monacha]|uniref:Pre-rRNA-processing protein Ipi1 N-terminal domain-containing protein n=1 Tax=Notodromas monacha TaxID=399045 RepID=A0A7R9BID4_9CRUS|nr:unnamed protein product [Notodromas monacha]CAG0915272.1 unnamed protein product [Notodromas monacha]